MTIKTKSLKHLVMKELKNNKPLYQDVPIPEGMINHGNAMVCGGIGSGKTTFLIRMLMLYEKTNTFSKIIFWSPTIEKEEKCEYLDHDITVIHKDFTMDKFIKYRDYIEKEIEDYKVYLKYVEIYTKAMKGQHITHEEERILESNDYEPMESEYTHMPCFCMVFDDLQSNRLIYSPTMKSDVAQWFLNTRHFNTVNFFLCQTWKLSVPKQLKSNIVLYVLFQCKSLKYQKDVAEDLVSVCPVETFVRYWDWACSKKYSAFVVNRNADEKLMFKRDFDTQIIMDDKDLNVHKGV